MKAPEFEENAVRATLSELLFSRQKFFSERVDGIFRSLSRSHVTNRPEGFSKRMVIENMFDQWGHSNYDRTGYVDDLRKVVAKFMGRDATGLNTTNKILTIARARPGEWVAVDGGALRVKAFLKGTIHLEIHPDMAWRLNDILAFLHPAASRVSILALNRIRGIYLRPREKRAPLPPVRWPEKFICDRCTWTALKRR